LAARKGCGPRQEGRLTPAPASPDRSPHGIISDGCCG
jgi:hypothetical protein